MHDFRKILVYSSPEDEAFVALEQAAALARGNGAAVTVVRVLEEGSSLGLWRTNGGDAEKTRRFLEDQQHALLEPHVSALQSEGLDVRAEVRWGPPWLELIRYVLRDGHDLVIKMAEGAARGTGLFFGSTALHLIRKCPCPVWIVNGPWEQTQGRVLAAIDPDEDETRSPLARRIMNLAVSMAGGSGELHAVSAWEATAESLLRSRVDPAELEEYVRSARNRASEGLEKVLATAGDPVPSERIYLLKGDPRRVLPELIERREFDLIVMGSLGRVGIAGFLIGETAETLIRSARCSVLVVKPPGFVSPVDLPET